MQRDDRTLLRLTRGLRSRVRRSASLYLLSFLLAVAVAPHRHLNSLADLLSDGPSDSGMFVESGPPDPTGKPRVQPARLVDDDPCLACFHHDYAATASTSLVVVQTLAPHLEFLASARRSVSGPVSEFLASRSPPRGNVPEPVSESLASRAPPPAL